MDPCITWPRWVVTDTQVLSPGLYVPARVQSACSLPATLIPHRPGYGMTPDVQYSNQGRNHWRQYAACRLCLTKIWQPPFPMVHWLCSLALGKRGHTGVECVCAEIVRGRVLYWADPAARTLLPFSSHKLSCVSMTECHWPRDTNPQVPAWGCSPGSCVSPEESPWSVCNSHCWLKVFIFTCLALSSCSVSTLDYWGVSGACVPSVRSASSWAV